MPDKDLEKYITFSRSGDKIEHPAGDSINRTEAGRRSEALRGALRTPNIQTNIDVDPNMTAGFPPKLRDFFAREAQKKHS